MKKFRTFSRVFLGIGVLLLFIALALTLKTRTFVARALHASGTVIELREVLDKDGGSSTYKPVVQYKAADGESFTFASSYSSRPPAYDVGESVEVMYRPGNPPDARIKGFGSLWLGSVILFGLGTLFAAIGGSIIYAGRSAERNKTYLMAYGTALQTDYQGVERNTSLAVNGKHPWRITSQWLDPSGKKLRVFNSENLWFDPEKFVTTKQITVLLDPKNPQKYHMDVSFLPEMES